MADVSRNGFQHKLMENGMKNLGVKFLYRVKFHVLDGDTTLNPVIGSGDIAAKFNKHKNNDATDAFTGNDYIDFIYFSRGVSGLPKWEVEPITDKFFIYSQKVPGKPKNEFGPISINIIIKETGEPILNFLSEINKLTRLQGTDYYARDGEGSVISNPDTNEEAQIADIITAGYNASNFARNQTKKIFFGMTVSALEYGSYKPWVTYKFNNCWLSKVDTGDGFKEDDNALMNGSIEVQYDFPEILFYDNNGNVTGDANATLPSTTTTT